MPPAEPIVEARGVEKSYVQPGGRKFTVVAPTDLEIRAGGIVALLGASGCGKSTLLRMLSGLSTPSAGAVLWHGRPMSGERPNVSIVFQSFALFPWLTVLANVEAPLEARGIAPVERRKRAIRILDVVGLDGFETAYPKELSGGMRQRVGFARALVVEPEVLFMDEPFSALDVLTAGNLRGELLELWTSKRIPTRAILMVTHNIEEAVFLADRIVILGGKPARIRSDFEVALPHPRDRQSPRFLELIDHVYKVLTRPKEEAAAAAPLPSGVAPAPARYLPIPHARPGGIAGLLEILADRDGRDDLYHLADELILEVDDLLPIVDAAALLGFLTVHEGDVEVTPDGRAFAEAEILGRKRLFRESALLRVPILRQMEHALRAKTDRALPGDFFHDLLDEHLGADDARRQLDTAILWGRYAEIFDYDAGSGRLILTEP
ncbi:MAG: nitrate/sulfonate/bicarbonate ABC transporter ATP-binding protein [Acidobacteriia bacterium]|nr:nitrate/sulfonate/bicarbonate ABC transporter ATP-binding protein [Terriglobia bacterium]